MQPKLNYLIAPGAPCNQSTALLGMALFDLMRPFQPIIPLDSVAVMARIRNLCETPALGSTPNDDLLVYLGRLSPPLAGNYRTATAAQAQRLYEAYYGQSVISTSQLAQPIGEAVASGFYHEGMIIIICGASADLNLAMGLCAAVLTGLMTAECALDIAKIGGDGERFASCYCLMSEALA